MFHPLTTAFECITDDAEVRRASSFAARALSLRDVPFGLQLPPELWEQVIDQLSDDPSALRECSLTCRAWLPAARQHLFHRVEFNSQDDCLRFLGTLDLSEGARTNLARHVKDVAVVGLPLCRLGHQYDNGNGFILHDVLQRLPNVTSLTLENVDIDVHLPLDYATSGIQLRPFSHLFPTPTLRTLAMSAVMFHSLHDISRLIAAFPQLHTLAINRALWWQNTGAPLQDKERAYTDRTLRNLARLDLFSVPSPVDLLRRIQRFPALQSTRQFGWTTYVTDEKGLLLGILRSSAANVKVLDVVTRYDSNLLAELDANEYVSVRSLSLMLAASAHKQDAFCDPLPSFLTHLDATHLCTLTLGFSLFRPTSMYWTFVDWPALDAALTALHERSPATLVVFRIAFVPAAGLSDNLTADVAGPLMENLRGALGAGTRIGVRCDLFDQIADMALREGALRWLVLDEQ